MPLRKLFITIFFISALVLFNRVACQDHYDVDTSTTDPDLFGSWNDNEPLHPVTTTTTNEKDHLIAPGVPTSLQELDTNSTAQGIQESSESDTSSSSDNQMDEAKRGIQDTSSSSDSEAKKRNKASKSSSSDSSDNESSQSEGKLSKLEKKAMKELKKQMKKAKKEAKKAAKQLKDQEKFRPVDTSNVSEGNLSQDNNVNNVQSDTITSANANDSAMSFDYVR